MAELQSQTDAELIDRYKAGEDAAFGELIRRHRDRMWAVALRTLGDAEDAADAVQDACLSAYRSAARFRGDAAVSTWLHRIVVNACLDRMRSARVRPSLPYGDQAALDAVLFETDRPTASGSESTDVALDVTDALRRLPYDQRAALVLVDMLGYAVDEAAELLDVPAGTVKSRCARGRAKLVPVLRHLRNRSGSRDVVAPEGGDA